MPRLSLEEVERLALGALLEAGAQPHQAGPVARSIRRAEADDIRAVGLGYLPTYLTHLRSGRVDGAAQPTLAVPRLAVVAVDAADGFAHPAFDLGLDSLVAAAHTTGTASLAITRSYSIGVLGHPVEDIAARGLLALAFTNSPPNLAPWGGRKKLLGTNPLAFAAPRRGAPPLVIDQATTVVTKVALAERAGRGEALPEGWAFDEEGKPTTDPEAGLAGSMAPAGGAKGANLALVVELLAAVLTGANLSSEVVPYAKAAGAPPGVGQLFLALDPAAFSGGFLARLEALASAIEGDAPARLPGARRLEARLRTAQDGVDVDDALLARIAGSIAP